MACVFGNVLFFKLKVDVVEVIGGYSHQGKGAIENQSSSTNREKSVNIKRSFK